jgi:hypothetical protein
MNYKEKQLKNLKEANELMSVVLGKFGLANYIGSLREYKELVGIKLKLERVLKRAEAGYNWEKRRYDGPRTRPTK